MCPMALFIMAKNWKQSKYPSAGERMNKLWYIHTLEHYSAIKKNHLRIHTTAYMHLKSVMLSRKKKKTQIEITHYRLPLIWNSRKGKLV